MNTLYSENIGVTVAIYASERTSHYISARCVQPRLLNVQQLVYRKVHSTNDTSVRRSNAGVMTSSWCNPCKSSPTESLPTPIAVNGR